MHMPNPLPPFAKCAHHLLKNLHTSLSRALLCDEQVSFNTILISTHATNKYFSAQTLYYSCMKLLCNVRHIQISSIEMCKANIKFYYEENCYRTAGSTV